MSLCRCQNKDNIRRRLLQCLEQCVKCSCRKHMHLIDDIHFVSAFCRTIGNFLPDLSNIVHTVVRCSVNLDHIHGSTGLNSLAHFTFITRASIYRMLTVYRFCQNFGHGCFTGTSRPAKEIGVSDSIRIDLIRQRGHNVILPLDVFKIIGPELSVQGSITHNTLLSCCLGNFGKSIRRH